MAKKSPVHSVDDFILEFEKIPDEDHFSFPYDIRNLRGIIGDQYTHLHLIYCNDKLHSTTRFKAFYCHLITLWRLKEFSLYRNLIDRHETNFKSYKLYNTFRAQYYLSKPKSSENLKLSVEYAQKAIFDLPNSPNVLHLFGELVADYQDFADEQDYKLLQQADQQMARAIAISDGRYAKYYATKSRILSLQSKFREAKDAIQQAIELEPSGNPEYPIRLGEYQDIKSRISYYEHSQKIQEKQTEAIKSLDEVRNKVIELLGLLSAIIAFVISSVQISKDLNFEDAAKLLIILGGVCIMVFAAFSMTFYRGPIQLNQLISVGLGLVLILVGLNIGLKENSNLPLKKKLSPSAAGEISTDTLTKKP